MTDHFEYISTNSFYCVDIQENSLILCDIDDTLLFTKENNAIQFILYEKCKKEYQLLLSEGIPQVEAFRMAEKTYYDEFISSHAIDPLGFADMQSKIETTGSVLMFLTAREPESFAFTQKNIADIGIDAQKYKIHYSGGRLSKGEYIRQHIDSTPYNKVIFIDNDFGNLRTVHMFGPQDKLELYYFDHSSGPQR